MTWWHCSAALLLGVNFLLGTKWGKDCSHKRAATLKTTLYPAGVASVFIVKVYKKIGVNNNPSILSDLLTPDLYIKSSFCSFGCLRTVDLNPDALCTLFPLEICRFYAYGSEHNKYVIVSLCRSRSGLKTLLENFGFIFVKPDGLFMQTLWKIEAGFRWIVCLT